MKMDKPAVAITLAVALVAGVIGVAVVDAVDGSLGRENDALHDRAAEEFGDEYTITSSSECMDYCVVTAATPDQRRADVLRVLQRHDGWVGEYTLSRNTPGTTVGDEVLPVLVESGTVEKRTEGAFPTKTSYRYTGNAAAPAPLTDAEVRERVRTRLYVTGTPMKVSAIADDLPVGEPRVKGALQDLESEGVVDSGYQAYMFLPEHHWVHTEHGSLPDSWLSLAYPPLTLAGGVLGASVLIAFLGSRGIIGTEGADA